MKLNRLVSKMKQTIEFLQPKIDGNIKKLTPRANPKYWVDSYSEWLVWDHYIFSWSVLGMNM